MDWHRLDHGAVMAALATSAGGLTAREAESRRSRYGANLLDEKEERSPFSVFFGQFKDAMTVILGVAAVISGIVGDVTDSLIILGITVLNAIIGFMQEYRADRAMRELKKLAAPWATVLRDG